MRPLENILRNCDELSLLLINRAITVPLQHQPIEFEKLVHACLDEGKSASAAVDAVVRSRPDAWQSWLKRGAPDPFGPRVHLANRQAVEASFNPSEPIEIARAGNYPHSSGVVQVLDGRSFGEIVDHFNEDRRKGDHVLLDFDHLSNRGIAGVLTGLYQIGGRLLGYVQWSRAGLDAVKGLAYRGVSPCFCGDTLENASADGRYVRPTRLIGVALTNTPAIEGMTPVTS